MSSGENPDCGPRPGGAQSAAGSTPAGVRPPRPGRPSPRGSPPRPDQPQAGDHEPGPPKSAERLPRGPLLSRDFQMRKAGEARGGSGTCRTGVYGSVRRVGHVRNSSLKVHSCSVTRAVRQRRPRRAASGHMPGSSVAWADGGGPCRRSPQPVRAEPPPAIVTAWPAHFEKDTSSPGVPYRLGCAGFGEAGRQRCQDRRSLPLRAVRDHLCPLQWMVRKSVPL